MVELCLKNWTRQVQHVQTHPGEERVVLAYLEGRPRNERVRKSNLMLSWIDQVVFIPFEIIKLGSSIYI
jgi:hypothetical protein